MTSPGLAIKNNSIDAAALMSLAEYVSSSDIVDLDIGSNKFGDYSRKYTEGLPRLAKELTLNPSLEKFV